MAENLTTIRRRRGGNVGYVNKLFTESEALFGQPGAKDDPEVEFNLRANKEIFEEKEELLKDYHNQIMSELTEEEDITSEVEEHNTTLKKLRKFSLKIDKWVNVGHEQKPAVATPLHPVVSKPINTSSRLPKLHLNSFDGDPLLFQPFWDTFESAIHKNRELDDISKFNYLKGLLEGNAKTCILGLSTTSENYKGAIDILHERFGDPQTIISSHMDQILKLRPVRTDNAKQLREIYDVIEIHMRNLNALDVSSQSYGPILNSIVMSKLPRNLKLDISRQMPRGKWDIMKLLDVLKRELVSRERCEQFDSLSFLEDSDNNPASYATLHVGDAPKISCTYCGKDHPSNRCDVVTNIMARKQILREKKKCFNCLRDGHNANACYSRYFCFNCKGKHHISICDRKTTRDGEQGNHVLATFNEIPEARNQTHNLMISACDNTLLQTANASLMSNESSNEFVNIRIMFDSCSQKSFVKSETCAKLKLRKIRSEILTVKTFGTNEEKIQKLDVVNLKIESLCGKGYRIIEAYSVPTICSPVSNQMIQLAVKKYPLLNGLILADRNLTASEKEIDVLIGANFYWSFTDGKSIRIDNSLVAMDTVLGWVLSGSFNPTQHLATINCISAHVLTVDCQQHTTHNELLNSMERFWEIESASIPPKNVEFDLESFLTKIQFNNERYSVPLPWKANHDLLPDNFSNSYKRLGKLMKRFGKNKEILQEYDGIIKQQEREGIIERVPEDSLVPPPGEIHYLPHHAVIRPERETSKLRIVYDASSNKPSLNDCLEKGPCLIPLILDVLVRFRGYKVGLISDIKQAYLNVGVNQGERDFLRFLWFEDVNADNPKMITYRFTRVIFGVTSSQFLLAAVIRKHLQNYDDPMFVNTFLRNLYVDDNISGARNTTEALDIYLKSKYRLLDAGLNLRKWHSNDLDLQQKISDYEKEIDSLSNLEIPADSNIKVLGVPWNNKSDNFFIELSIKDLVDENFVATKRNVLKVISSIYDPIGFMSPITVVFKMFFQLLCISKMHWDDPLSCELIFKWTSLVDSASGVYVTVPRYYFTAKTEEEPKVTLHGFCDASKRAYAAVIYVTTNSPENVTGQFVACKTKVSPIKSLSIPKLELCACLLLTNLMSSVVSALEGVVQVSSRICWSDSMDSLFWIKDVEKKRSTFVENRVKVIRRTVPPSCWRFCPGNENPADLPSRGVEKVSKVNEKLKEWLNGPGFIYDTQDTWPEDFSEITNDKLKLNKISEEHHVYSKDHFHKAVTGQKNGPKISDLKNSCLNGDLDSREMRNTINASENETMGIHVGPEEFKDEILIINEDRNKTIGHLREELLSKRSKIESMTMVNTGRSHPQVLMDVIMDLCNYSGFDEVLRITGYLMRFIHNSSPKEGGKICRSGYLTLEEVYLAENLWMRTKQHIFYNNVNQMKYLKKGLGVYVDDEGVLRCKGRLNNSQLPVSTRNPILLPKKDRLSFLLVRKSHADTQHGTIKDTLTELRRKYWVINARRMVTSYISKCTLCKRLDGAPFKSQESSQLPAFRVCQSFPFSNTGVDYAGPFMVKPIYNNESNSEMYNVHIALYTCAATRAVHLDLVPDLSASSFLRSLKRFIGRRGIPCLMISDNATCFKNEEVKLSEELLLMGVRWKFIVEASPWWGGFWERLVKSVKRSLYRTVSRACVTYEELLTVIIEIEGIMNSRPLTYINSDMEEILTPGHLMIGKRIIDPNEDVLNDEDVSNKVYMTKRAKYLKSLSEHYWSRWTYEYLLELRNTHTQGENSQGISVGEVIIVHEKTKRHLWKLGIVIKLLPGPDNIVRAVVIKTCRSGRKPTYIKRPIELLYPLELRSQETVSPVDIEEANKICNYDEFHDAITSVSNRPRREAAENGIIIRRLLGGY